MSSPLYARIPTTHFGCGCTVHVEPDANGITPWLEFCLLHAQAEGMRALLQALLPYACSGGCPEYESVKTGKIQTKHTKACREARALLRAAEGRITP